jgi:hypothetical protein
MLCRHVQRQTHGDTEIRRRPARIGAPTHGPLPSKPLAGRIAAIDLLIGGIRPLWARAFRGRPLAGMLRLPHGRPRPA